MKGKRMQCINIYNNSPPDSDIILHFEDLLPEAYQSGEQVS